MGVFMSKAGRTPLPRGSARCSDWCWEVSLRQPFLRQVLLGGASVSPSVASSACSDLLCGLKLVFAFSGPAGWGGEWYFRSCVSGRLLCDSSFQPEASRSDTGAGRAQGDRGEG